MISYFLADDTVLVFEPPQRNSGLPGGNFAERGKVRRPAGGALDHYRAQDMKVRLAALMISTGLALCSAGHPVVFVAVCLPG